MTMVLAWTGTARGEVQRIVTEIHLAEAVRPVQMILLNTEKA